MRHHTKVQQELSLVDIRQIAMTQYKYVVESDTTLNSIKLFSLTSDEGLYTLDEIKQKLLH